jgi:hypothetical protein
VNRAHEAIAALVADDADAARVAEVWTELARFEELRGARGAAQIAVRSALSVDPTHEGALALAKKIGAELPAAPEPAPARAPFGRAERVVTSPRARARTAHPGAASPRARGR